MIEMLTFALIGMAWWRCCCGTVCSMCTSGTAPASFDVTFSGVAAGSCGSCTDYNTTTFNCPFVSSDANLCTWQIVSDAVCGKPLTIALAGPVDDFIDLDVNHWTGSNITQWQAVHQVLGALDCTTVYTDIAITASNNPVCDWTNALMTLTPVA